MYNIVGASLSENTIGTVSAWAQQHAHQSFQESSLGYGI